jgi:deoxyribose-phosphate aldolase
MSLCMNDPAKVARRALSLLDLTNLDEDCDEKAVDALAARAVTPHGRVAALCIYPRWIGRALRKRPSTAIRVATVANFPTGSSDIGAALRITEEAMVAGADEVDVVLPWRALLAGDHKTPAELVRRCKALLPDGRLLKVILETGELRTDTAIATASRIALDEGADFLKTSTGKVPINATPGAAQIMLEAIRECGRPAGFKAAGGIRVTGEAEAYLGLAAMIMGEEWISPATFRFGASSLLADLLSVLGDRPTAAPQSRY